MFFDFMRRPRAGRTTETESLQLGSRTVPLLVVRNPRARRYLLRVQPDGAARVTIPRGGSRSEAQSFIERNRRWLEQQVERVHSQSRLPKAWRVGSEILFRGEWVRIEIVESLQGLETVHWNHEPGKGAPSVARRETDERGGDGPSPHPAKLCGDKLSPPRFHGGRLIESGAETVFIRFGTETVAVNDATADLRPAIERHLRAMAGRELPGRVMELAASHQLPVRRVTVRNQRSRWGSCSRHGTISLNWRLVQTPVFVRDYIILHELAHLRQMNHSQRFWREVERLCPDYLVAERWLKANRSLLR